ncbi:MULTISPECIES: ABC transporter permease [unclassified Moraxella]|uniref:ABC transporter permease n=1 Tax=unclassified Moraxella TaxID=2685852 RepID=UPI003AF5C900
MTSTPSSSSQKNALLAFWQAFYYSAKREWQFLMAKPFDFAMIFWLPFITTFLVWWIFSRGMITDIPIGIVDNSHSPQSATLIRYIDSTPDVAVTQQFWDTASAQHAIQRGQVYGVVEIPSDFATQLLTAQPTRILLNVNAQYGTHSGMIQKGVQSAVLTYSAGAKIQGRIAKGQDSEQTKATFNPIQTQMVGLFNRANNYQQFLAVTVIPALLHILAMVIGASTLGREIRDKTIDDWYQCLLGNGLLNNGLLGNDLLGNNLGNNLTNTTSPTPTTPPLTHPDILMPKPNFWLLMAGLNGKFIWQMLAYTLWGAVLLTLAMQLHPISLGAWLVTYTGFLLLMMLSFWLGLIVTLGTFSYRQGLSMTAFIAAPSFAFSGVTFPYIAMSDGAKKWADCLPLTHYLRIQIPQLEMSAPPSLAIPIVLGFMVAVALAMLWAIALTRRALATPHRWGQR